MNINFLKSVFKYSGIFLASYAASYGTGLIIGNHDKIIKKFKKENDLPEVKGILFDGEFVPGSEYGRLADLPSKEESLAKLVSMLNSPLQKLVSTINAPIQNTLGALNNLKENKS